MCVCVCGVWCVWCVYVCVSWFGFRPSRPCAKGCVHRSGTQVGMRAQVRYPGGDVHGRVAGAARMLQGAESLLLAGGAFVQRVDAPDAQGRDVVRHRGREDRVEKHQHEDAQSKSAGAQPGRRRGRERRPGAGAASVRCPLGGALGFCFSPDVTAFWFIIG